MAFIYDSITQEQEVAMHEARERGWTARLTKEVSLNVECRAGLILDHGTLWLGMIVWGKGGIKRPH